LRNPSGKVLKRVLREEISRDLQAPRELRLGARSVG
jgi:hypothetical protein